MARSRDCDLADPDTYKDGVPHDVFRELREHEPISWRTEKAGRGFWAVTRYHDIVSILRTPGVYSSWRGGALLADPPPEFLDKLREGLLNRDPPDHTKLRRLVNKALSPRQIERLDLKVAQRAKALVGSIRERGHCDFALEIAREMPLFMISEILGVPTEDRQALHELTIRALGTYIADPKEALRDQLAAANALRDYGGELRTRKAAAPGDDLASKLVAAEIEGRRLTEGEFRAFFLLLFNAGTDTTRGLLCYGLDLLLQHPESAQRLRAEPALLESAIEEMLRYESPLLQVRRTATRDVELAGAQIKEGDKVVVFFPSANREAAVFPDPDRFDIARTPNDHIAFGFGAHHCLGAPLARLEARHVFREVLAQLRDIERSAPAVTLRSNFVRGLRSLQIRFAAA